jgi:hypothetical protein
LVEGSLSENIELFKRASNVRAVEGDFVLLNFVLGVLFNVRLIHRHDGKGNGKQYHASTIKLFEVLQNFGASSTHNFISKILVRLVLNTTRSIFYKVPYIDINEFTFCYMYSIFNAHAF